jgi:hypothetical protein
MRETFAPVKVFGRAAKMSTTVAVFNVFSVHVISLVVAFLAVVAVFVYIPFVSDYAFWFMVAAYIMLAGHRG